MTVAPRACAACGSEAAPTDRFCESCGAPLNGDPGAIGMVDEASSTEPDGAGVDRTHLVEPRVAANAPTSAQQPRVCADCGGEVDENRWCTVCGLRAPSPRDHWVEAPATWVGAVCDRGKRHARNEDAMGTAADESASFCVLVVCDGVTTAADSDIASLAAATAARDALVAARLSASDSPAAQMVHWTAEVEAASLVANAAATAVADAVPKDVESPSCTFVAAVLDGPFVVAGWVGDSRAYWLPDTGTPLQLTVDDSWATDQITLGMSREAAEADARAHSITRWLGADASDPKARCSSVPLDGPGWLLVCSDGLWNYCSPADDLRLLVHATVDEHGDDPVTVAERLVAFANDRGGHDNITAALARVRGARSDPSTAAADPDAETQLDAPPTE